MTLFHSRVETLPRWQALPLSLLLTTTGALVLMLLAKVAFPLPGTPVPVSLSVLAVLLLGGLLGPRLAPAAVLQYLALGMAGVPVFSGAAPGLGIFASPTAGYLLAFAPAAALYAVIYGRVAARPYGQRLAGAALAGLAAVAVIYLGGALWLATALRQPVTTAYLWGILPFIGYDLCKAAVAAVTVALWTRKGC